VTQLRDAKVDTHTLAQRIVNKCAEDNRDVVDIIAHCLLLLPFFTPLVRGLPSSRTHCCVCIKLTRRAAYVHALCEAIQFPRQTLRIDDSRQTLR
jgi:hypothetical protein